MMGVESEDVVDFAGDKVVALLLVMTVMCYYVRRPEFGISFFLSLVVLGQTK